MVISNINRDKLVISEKAAGALAQLSDYLKNLALHENENKEELIGFDMQHYHRFTDGDEDKNECGSTACAVGHCAVMMGFIPTNDGVITRKQTEDGDVLSWSEFSQKYIDMGNCGTKEEALVWEWFFSGEWDEVDNTPLGVVARIEYFLEHGIPHNFIISNSSAKYNYTMVDEYLERRVKLESETELARSTHA